MNTEEQADIYQALTARRQNIAARYFDLIAEANPTAHEISTTRTTLQAGIDQIITLLIAEPFNAELAQRIGVNLEKLGNLQPKNLINIQTMLTQELTTDLTPAHTTILQPRIASLLCAMTVGFFAEKAERAKVFNTTAMSMMGHDLKTPINAVTGFSRVILKGIDGPITEFQQQDLTSIYDAGQKLLTMIDELFRTAKSDAAKTDIYTTPFDIIDLLSDVMQVGQPIVARRDHTLEMRCVGELGTMHADASQVRWVLLGLLYYTARLTSNSTISLTASRETVQDLDWFFFEIVMLLPDNVSERDKLSAAFWAEASEKGEEDIGLITSKRICEDLGGNVMLERDGNWLAKFTVRLPVR